MWTCTAGWLNVLNSKFIFNSGVIGGMPFVIAVQKQFFGFRFIRNCFNNNSGILDYYGFGGDAADVRDAAEGRSLKLWRAGLLEWLLLVLVAFNLLIACDLIADLQTVWLRGVPAPTFLSAWNKTEKVSKPKTESVVYDRCRGAGAPL